MSENGQSQPEKDVFLALIVQGINQTKSEMGLTLHVNGLVVSGVLCSMTTYALEQADMLRRHGVPGFAEVFDTLADGQGEATAADEAGGLPDFIHLKDATVYAPGSGTSLPKTLWRGRLGHVSGWSVGSYAR